MSDAATTAISLGWGVQSFGLAAMAALGELPRVDVAIHADTTHEMSATYAFAQKWTPWLEDHGLRVVTVVPADPRYVQRKGKSVPMGVFTDTRQSRGMLPRQCTYDWKIRPIRKWLRAHRPGSVELWIGITLDEIQRAKPSRVKYLTHRWPYLEGENPLRRSGVARWLEARGLEIPPRSACYFCPFHSDAGWRAVKATEDWARAIAVDEAIRKVRPPWDLYLHRSVQPLASVDLRSDYEMGQLDLWTNECEGVCGV